MKASILSEPDRLQPWIGCDIVGERKTLGVGARIYSGTPSILRLSPLESPSFSIVHHVTSVSMWYISDGQTLFSGLYLDHHNHLHVPGLYPGHRCNYSSTHFLPRHRTQLARARGIQAKLPTERRRCRWRRSRFGRSGTSSRTVHVVGGLVVHKFDPLCSLHHGHGRCVDHVRVNRRSRIYVAARCLHRPLLLVQGVEVATRIVWRGRHSLCESTYRMRGGLW